MTKSEATAGGPNEPVVLTRDEVAEVAGGAALSVARLAGCPGCTSGGYLNLRDAYAAVVNPAAAVTTNALAAR